METIMPTVSSGLQDKRRGIGLLRDNISRVVLGCDKEVDLLILGLLAQGHVLIQGAPGVGKTSMAKSLATSLDCDFKRIQFTPDLMPADILGYSIYDQSNATFKFHRGPVFTNILLADEINRTTPRIQSALLEAMNEAQVSVDGKTYILEQPFFVIATQNHLHSSGTFPLPDSQLDRFLISIDMGNPGLETRENILKLHWKDANIGKDLKSVLSAPEILELRESARQVDVEDSIFKYIARLVEATHESAELTHGVSPRASIALMRTAQTAALMDGRKHVYPDDVKNFLPYVFSHRLTVKGLKRKGGESVANVIVTILDKVPVG